MKSLGVGVVEPQRSYLGAASCTMFVIASLIVGYLFYNTATATYKLAGLEAIVLMPAALVIYGLGIAFGCNGWRHVETNPGSRVGLFLNAVPVGLFFGTIIYGMIFGHR